MKDSLRDFIHQHREAFDNREPSEEVWRGIASKLPHGRSRTLWNNVSLWRAAAVLFMGLSAYFFYAGNQDNLRPAESAKLQGEFKDLESFYSEQIAEKIDLISHIQESDMDDSFTQDVQKLEAMYQVLREQMKTDPSEKVKDALVLNLLVRVDLLNQQIKRIEDSRKKKKVADVEV